MESVGDRIARARAAKGMNQSDLARELKVTPQAVQKWESGGSPKGARLREVAQVLGTTIEYLLADQTMARGTIMGSSSATASYSVTKQDFEFIRRVNALPGECRKTLEMVLAEQERLLKPATRAPMTFVEQGYATDVSISGAGNRLILKDKKQSNRR